MDEGRGEIKTSVWMSDVVSSVIVPSVVMVGDGAGRACGWAKLVKKSSSETQLTGKVKLTQVKQVLATLSGR